jgi:hypothetical protein
VRFAGWNKINRLRFQNKRREFAVTTQDTETKCCPKFDPAPWQDKELIWKDKLFVRDTVPQFMHMPLPGSMGKTIGRMWKKIEESGARPEDKDMIMLATETSPWRGVLLINATREVPGAENVRLSGTFATKVFDGPYNAVPKWIKEMEGYLAPKNQTAKNYYFYYTTCPKCAKKYGHNYTVAFAEV